MSTINQPPYLINRGVALLALLVSVSGGAALLWAIVLSLAALISG